MEKIWNTPSEVLKYAPIESNDFYSECYGYLGYSSTFGTDKWFIRMLPFDGFYCKKRSEFTLECLEKVAPIGDKNQKLTEGLKDLYLGVFEVEKTNPSDYDLGYVVIAPDGSIICYFTEQHESNNNPFIVSPYRDEKGYARFMLPHYDYPWSPKATSKEIEEFQTKSLYNLYDAIAKQTAKDVEIAKHLPCEMFQCNPEFGDLILKHYEDIASKKFNELQSDYEEKEFINKYNSRVARLKKIFEMKKQGLEIQEKKFPKNTDNI